MEELTRKTVVVFSRPFSLPGFAETLPAGEYEIETELAPPPDRKDPEIWKASVLVKRRPNASHPGLERTLTVTLADLAHARARDRLTGRALLDFFVEEMLSDPMVRLVMKADGVSEAHLRHLYSVFRSPDPDLSRLEPLPAPERRRYEASILAAENEGMPTRPETRPRN
ncbi:hypothetical protein [Thioclava electrotropha]|uniref:Uncharacterized protein n=1 Tax=Thioclava electrotropha TaxID=1549850 RepID=A0ABX6YS15_9RHOB|nr:hypothetical protein [Thioclava electrotropha]QPZ90043.1 hypothetical protein AKL02_003520 [Thioclava electrotropha]